MDLLVLFFHVLMNFFLGVRCLSSRSFSFTERFCLATLLGFFIETTLGFWLLIFGLPITMVSLVLLILTLGVNIPSLLQLLKNPSSLRTSFANFFQELKRIKWYEWLLIAFILEKIVFVGWQLLRMPTYHSDAIKHWSSVGRAMYGGDNWNLILNTPSFLGRKMGFVSDYPLGVPIWRAISASYNFGWNDFLSRSDGLVFLLLITGLIYAAFKYFTKERWIGLGAAVIISSLPLQVWQGASGYVDNAVGIFVLSTIWAFIRKDWVLSGFFAAGAIWSKNDGLAIFLPGFLAAMFFYTILLRKIVWKDKFKRLFQVALGFSPIFPWLIFQGLYSDSIFNRIIKPIQGLFSVVNIPDYQVVLVQKAGTRFEGSPNSLSLFWEHVFTGSSHGVFWLLAIIVLLLLLRYLLLDHLGRCLLLYLAITSVIIYYVFTYTPAYEYLLIQTTIHRTLLQFAPVVLVIIGYGISLHLLTKKEEPVLIKKVNSKIAKKR